MTTYIPTPEQVAVAWVKTLPTLDPTKVATSLPADSNTWGPTGFVQVTALPGGQSDHVPLYAPVIQLDCWAANPGSNKPPWGRAGSMAQAVVWATYRFRGRLFEFGDDFQPAAVVSVRPIAQPRRVFDDEAGFARVQLDIEMTWTPADGPVVA